MDNKFKLLREEKVQAEVILRIRLDQGMEQIAGESKQLADLKYTLAEKERQHHDFRVEFGKHKQFLDEKNYEYGKLREQKEISQS
jgi:hypothetical protein